MKLHVSYESVYFKNSKNCKKKKKKKRLRRKKQPSEERKEEGPLLGQGSQRDKSPPGLLDASLVGALPPAEPLRCPHCGKDPWVNRAERGTPRSTALCLDPLQRWCEGREGKRRQPRGRL